MQSPIVAGLTGLLCLPCLAAAAPPASPIAMQPLLVQGSADFQASGINAQGDIVGTLYTGSTASSGIELSGTKVVRLPTPAGSWGTFQPQAINAQGDILGWARNTGGVGGTDMFLYQNGAYNTAYQAPLIEPGSNINGDTPLPIALTDNWLVSFNTLISLSAPVGTSYGRPPHYRHVPPMNRYTHINSIDAAGAVAGVTYGLSGASAVYFGQHGVFVTVAPPNAATTLGGYLNRSGALAGSFRDTAGAWHGFVYAHAAFALFDMPQTATAIAVDAIDRRGRVVGGYATADGRQHGFLYNGSVVTSFGSYPAADTLGLAVSGRGTILLARLIAASGEYRSFRITCSGSAC